MLETPVAPLGPFLCPDVPIKSVTVNQSCKHGQALSRKGSLFQGLGPYLKERVPLGFSLAFWVPTFFIFLGKFTQRMSIQSACIQL